MDCLAVRDRLAEHAVSALPGEDRAGVDRHLEWCAGCRKEAGELRRGAALAGLSLVPAEPRHELEDRVVRTVRSAATKAAPRRRRSLVRGAVLIAAVVGLTGVTGGLLAHQQSLKNRITSSGVNAVPSASGNSK